MQDVSGFGSKIQIVASQTFPAGFTVTQASDDSDFFSMEDIDLVESSMGGNGDLITWTSPKPLPCTMAVIAGSEDDINLSILAETNRAGRGKASVRDTITVSTIYPDGSVIQLTQGRITKAAPARTIGSDGKIKTRSYSFVFENKTGV